MRSYFPLVLLSQVMSTSPFALELVGQQLPLSHVLFSSLISRFSYLIHTISHHTSPSIKSPSTISKSKDLHNQIKRGPSF